VPTSVALAVAAVPATIGALLGLWQDEFEVWPSERRFRRTRGFWPGTRVREGGLDELVVRLSKTRRTESDDNGTSTYDVYVGQLTAPNADWPPVEVVTVRTTRKGGFDAGYRAIAYRRVAVRAEALGIRIDDTLEGTFWTPAEARACADRLAANLPSPDVERTAAGCGVAFVVLWCGFALLINLLGNSMLLGGVLGRGASAHPLLIGFVVLWNLFTLGGLGLAVTMAVRLKDFPERLDAEARGRSR
jgi:hypothetical protein